jgi:hypothetical protein
MRMSRDQAAQSGPDGYWVLNGAADGPATAIVRDAQGNDVRAKSREEARSALSAGGYHYPDVALTEHDFPDPTTQETRTVKVWVPQSS